MPEDEFGKGRFEVDDAVAGQQRSLHVGDNTNAQPVLSTPPPENSIGFHPTPRFPDGAPAPSAATGCYTAARIKGTPVRLCIIIA
jgi:hypothetical protein